MTLVWDMLGLHLSLITPNTRKCGMCGYPLTPLEVSQPPTLEQVSLTHLKTTAQYEETSTVNQCELTSSPLPSTQNTYLCGVESFRSSAMKKCGETLYSAGFVTCVSRVDPIPYFRKCLLDLCSLPSFYERVTLCKVWELFRVRCIAEGFRVGYEGKPHFC